MAASPSSPSRLLVQSDVRHSIRGVLEVLLDDPGALSNPLYVGPLRSVLPLSEEVYDLASHRGVPVVAGAGLPEQGPAIWLASAEAAAEAIEAGRAPAAGIQWVIWGDKEAQALPAPVASRVDQDGLVLRPGLGGLEGRPGWSMEPPVQAASHAAEASGRTHYVLVVGEANDLGTLAAELQLHLELSGAPRVWRGPVAAWTDGDAGACRVLIVGAAQGGADLARRLERSAGMGGVWGLVVEAAESDRWATEPAWAGVLDRSRVLRRTRAPELLIPEKSLPSIADLLVGAPESRPAAQETNQFHLRLMPLWDVFVQLENWKRCGTLVVYAADRIAWIDVAYGRIRSVARPGGQSADEPDAVLGWLREVARWGDASVVYVPGAELPESERRQGTPVGTLAFQLAQGADEAAYGSQIARKEFPPRRTYEVAEALLSLGLADAANALLERAERASSWGVEEEMLLGHLSAERDPQVAAARLRHGALRLVSDDAVDVRRIGMYVGATLSALLLEVRGGQTLPSVAFAVVADWLEDASTAWVTSARHAAIWLELALRAGQTESARLAQTHLETLAAGECTSWAALLALDLEAPARRASA